MKYKQCKLENNPPKVLPNSVKIIVVIKGKVGWMQRRLFGSLLEKRRLVFTGTFVISVINPINIKKYIILKLCRLKTNDEGIKYDVAESIKYKFLILHILRNSSQNSQWTCTVNTFIYVLLKLLVTHFNIIHLQSLIILVYLKYLSFFFNKAFSNDLYLHCTSTFHFHVQYQIFHDQNSISTHQHRIQAFLSHLYITPQVYQYFFLTQQSLHPAHNVIH